MAGGGRKQGFVTRHPPPATRHIHVRPHHLHRARRTEDRRADRQAQGGGDAPGPVPGRHVPRFQPLRHSEGHRRRRRPGQRQARPRPATRSATATTSASRLPEPTHDLPVPEDIPLDDPLRGRVPGRHQQAVRHGGPPGQGALERHAGQRPAVPLRPAEPGQRRLPARHRPPPRPRHQRRHPGRQGGSDPPRPEHCSSSSARSSRNTWPSRPACSTATAITSKRRIGHHPHDRVKMAVDRRRGRGQGRVQLLRGDRAFPRLHVLPHLSRAPAGRTRSASTWPASAARCWPTRSTAAATAFRLSDLVPDLDPAEDEVLLPRQALHAARLRFVHPRLRRIIEIEAPLPPEFETAPWPRSTAPAAVLKSCSGRGQGLESRL